MNLIDNCKLHSASAPHTPKDPPHEAQRMQNFRPQAKCLPRCHQTIEASVAAGSIVSPADDLLLIQPAGSIVVLLLTSERTEAGKDGGAPRPGMGRREKGGGGGWLYWLTWIISSGYVRSAGLMDAPLISRYFSASTGGPPSIGFPLPLKMRPIMSSDTGVFNTYVQVTRQR